MAVIALMVEKCNSVYLASCEAAEGYLQVTGLSTCKYVRILLN